MGLDIRAYSRCRFVAQRVDGDYDEHEDKHVLVYVLDAFLERLDGKPQGWYAVDGESAHFHAGAYGGYNRWREQLCEAALGVHPKIVWDDPERFAGRPFVELINFADNEGAIGPKTSAKLLADFSQHPDLPGQVDNEPFDWFERKYWEWHKGFALAADAGFVVFS